MLPSQLNARQFNGYPPEAKELVTSRIAVLRQMPLSLLPLVLREAIAYDWKFPAERGNLDHQLAYLSSLSGEQLQLLMVRFAQLRLSGELERMDWVNEPQRFSEQLTAHLWATHQIDGFREAALEYGQKMDATAPAEPIPIPRLAIVVIGKGVAQNNYPLFRKLRPWGVYFKRVDAAEGHRILLEAVIARAQAHPVPFAHWYIDGGAGETISSSGVTCVSYEKLENVRTALLGTDAAGGSGTEWRRTRRDFESLPNQRTDGRVGDAVVQYFFRAMVCPRGIAARASVDIARAFYAAAARAIDERIDRSAGQQAGA
jgi:hypothetical protein